MDIHYVNLLRLPFILASHCITFVELKLAPVRAPSGERRDGVGNGVDTVEDDLDVSPSRNPFGHEDHESVLIPSKSPSLLHSTLQAASRPLFCG
jgi:hypothetical protein